MKTRHLVSKKLQKTTFRRCWDSVNVGVIFLCFVSALGTLLVAFGALGAGLKLDEFLMAAQRKPGAGEAWLVEGNLVAPWAPLQ